MKNLGTLLDKLESIEHLLRYACILAHFLFGNNAGNLSHLCSQNNRLADLVCCEHNGYSPPILSSGGRLLCNV